MGQAVRVMRDNFHRSRTAQSNRPATGILTTFPVALVGFRRPKIDFHNVVSYLQISASQKVRLGFINYPFKKRRKVLIKRQPNRTFICTP